MSELAPPPEVPLAARRWGLGDVALGWLLLRLGAELWVVGVLAATGRLNEDFDQLPLSVFALGQVGLAFGFVAVPYLATRLKGNGLVVDLGLRAKWNDLWGGGVPGALLQLLAIPLLYWPLLEILNKTTSDISGPARSLSDRADGAIGVALLILVVGVLAPIVEEIFYRGLVQQSLLKRGLSPVVAITATTVFFGVSHFQFLQLPGLLLAGGLFGVLAHRSGRLGPAITAHIAFNMVTVVALLVA